MTRRALCAWDLQRLTGRHLEVLQELARDHDELVVVITHAEQAYTPEHPWSAGERIARAMPVLRASLTRPVFVLPIKRGDLSEAQYAARIRLGAPRFETMVCASPREAAVAARVLGCATRVIEIPPDPPLDPDPPGSGALPSSTRDPVRRGLFVTRAQFFHVGHRAFVRQMAEEQDEVIVLVAKANASHSIDHPATAGERLEMIRPLLAREAPGRSYLCAAPYVDDDGANFAELALLLPEFQSVYTNSPITAAMAASDGYRVVSLAERVTASGSDLRRRIVAGEPYEHLLPEDVLTVLRSSPALPRLCALARAEIR